jgi:hypothetical protein
LISKFSDGGISSSFYKIYVIYILLFGGLSIITAPVNFVIEVTNEFILVQAFKELIVFTHVTIYYSHKLLSIVGIHQGHLQIFPLLLKQTNQLVYLQNRQRTSRKQYFSAVTFDQIEGNDTHEIIIILHGHFQKLFKWKV